MTDPRRALGERGLRPKKSFGQNFLTSEETSAFIADACVPLEERELAHVLELGAGTGALTAPLVERAARVVAVERDRELLPVLAERFADAISEGKLTLVEGDAKVVNAEDLLGEASGGHRVLAGNLPYQLTGPLLVRAVEQARTISRAVFLLQDEVVARLEAEPGNKIYGALTVFVTAAFKVKRLRTVGRNCFFPPPDVTSAVVALVPHAVPRAEETPIFRSLVKGAFEQRRKTLRNAWSRIGSAEEIAEAAKGADIDLDARGETLDVEAFNRMALCVAGARATGPR